MKSSGWIGVDLDGTLAEHRDDWSGKPEDIGKPIPAMVERVKRWLAEGREVRIVTARVSRLVNATNYSARVIAEAHQDAIYQWTKNVFGVGLAVQAHKDYAMVELWDDRAVRVVKNEGGIDCQFIQAVTDAEEKKRHAAQR